MKLNRHQLTGANLHLISFDTKGEVADDIVWAAPNRPGQSFGTVGHYRSLGCRIVGPKEVETLPGGTQRPASRAYGVLFDFDERAGEVRNPLDMVMMHRPASVRAEIEAEAAQTQAAFARRDTKPQVMQGSTARPDLMLEVEHSDRGSESIAG